MLATIRHFKYKLSLSYVVQRAVSSNQKNVDVEGFSPKFSKTQEEKILTTINEPSGDQLLGLNVSQNKIKHLETHKKRNGLFKTLDELLEVDGLNVKTLEKLCKQIIADAPSQPAKLVNNDHKKIKQFLIPPLSNDLSNSLCSSVGIHLAPMGVSWAKIVRSTNEVEFWGYQDFQDLPKKICPIDTFRLATQILRQVPTADVYVLEGTNGMGSQGQKQQAAVTSYTLQLELSSMLLALLNTNNKYNRNYEESLDHDVTNCVYFLRSKLPARLFKTLVGNECVSNTSTVLHLIGELSASSSSQLPCTPINVKQKLKSDYLTQSAPHKELLGHALLLTIAFTDLCVNENPISLKTVIPGRKKVI